MDEESPPSIPDIDEPPPIPADGMALGPVDSDEPPPIPIDDEPPPIPDEPKVSSAIIKNGENVVSSVTHAERRVAFVTADRRGQSHTVVETGSNLRVVNLERATPEIVIQTATVSKITTERKPVLAWAALILALVCIPLSVAAIPLPVLWIPVLVLSLLARSFGAFVKEEGGQAAHLGALAVQLGRGFLFIAIVGIIFILAVIAIWALSLFSQGIHEWQASNATAHWFVGQVQAVEDFCKSLFSHGASGAPPAPSPSPTR